MISDLGNPDFLSGGNKSNETHSLAMDSFFEYEMSDPQVTLWGQEAYKTASPVQSTSTPTTPPYSQTLQLESQMLGVSSLQALSSADGRHTTVIAGSSARQPVCTPPPQQQPRQLSFVSPHGALLKRSRGKNFVDPCEIAPLKKRRIQVEMLSPDERDKVLHKREKNKVAAEKCRVKRREKVQQMRAEYDEFLEANEALESDIQRLRELKEQLEEIMENHHCVVKLKA